MSAAAVDRAPLHEALQTLAGRIAGMIRDLPDTNIQIPRTEWTVGEAAAHLAVTKGWAVRVFTGEDDLRYGDGTIDSLAPTNARYLSEFQERDGGRLAEVIVEATESFVQAASAMPANRVFETPMGRMDTTTAMSYMLTHLMMHGGAIAKAMRRPYPIDPIHVELALPFLIHAMPLIVDRKAAGHLNACFYLRFRGGSRVAVTVIDGEAVVETIPSRRVDCYISADPVAFFLVATGLESHWRLIARGKLMTWGRRPWLAVRLPTLFVVP
jgi:uncharacterized protein (TIGR03083 family)